MQLDQSNQYDDVKEFDLTPKNRTDKKIKSYLKMPSAKSFKARRKIIKNILMAKTNIYSTPLMA